MHKVTYRQEGCGVTIVHLKGGIGYHCGCKISRGIRPTAFCGGMAGVYRVSHRRRDMQNSTVPTHQTLGTKPR